MWHTVSVNWGASYRIGKPFGPNGINYHLIMVWTERRKRIRKIEDRRVTITSPGPPRITSALVNSPGRMHHRSYSPSWLVFYEMWSGPRPLIIYFHISAIQSQRVLSCWAAELATWGERGRPEIILAKVTYIALFLRIQESKLKS